MSVETIAELLGVVGADFRCRTVAHTVAGTVPGLAGRLRLAWVRRYSLLLASFMRTLAKLPKTRRGSN